MDEAAGNNAADIKAITRKRHKADAKEATRKLVIATLMSQVEGRRYIWNELEEMNVFSQTLQFGRDGYAATAWAEGKRSLGIRLHAAVTSWCPAEYMLMVKENAKVDLTEMRDETVSDE